MVTRSQLLQFGYSRHAISHRIAIGRLHPVWPGVYAVGRPELTRYGRWMAAVLACGPGALLSHISAGELREMLRPRGGPIHVTAPGGPRRLPGITAHRTAIDPADRDEHQGIPVTSPVATLIDLAAHLDTDHLEAAIREADKLDLVHPDELRARLDDHRGRRGVAALRRVLDHRTFVLTDSKLERLFLPLARRAGLSAPQTQQIVNSHRVDFVWPDLGLIVETDGLRYHRTPAQQARDRRRDQTLTAAGFTVLRFTHDQVAHRPEEVVAILRAVARRLS